MLTLSKIILEGIIILDKTNILGSLVLYVTILCLAHMSLIF